MDDVDSDSGSDGEPTWRIAAVLVQTCDKYSWFWPAWHFFFHRAWKAGWEVYLMTEELDTEFPGIRTLRTGSGCFSDRLTAALSQLPHQYVLYVQDDFWPIQQCPALTFQRLLSAVQEHDMHFLRLLNEPETRSIASGRVAAAECDDGSQVCGRRLLRMHPESPFLLSHQSTLWRRELLLECMRDGENAFENEVLGTQRLQARFADHPSTLRAFALRFDWYRAVMGSPGPAGKLNAYGEVLQKYHRACTRDATAVCSPTIAGATCVCASSGHNDDSASSGTASTAGGTSGHPEGGGEREGWLYTAALLPPEWRGKLSGADAAYKRLEALFAQATGAAGGKPPEVRCPLCGDVYRGHSAWYSFRHPCPQRRRAAWFSQQRSDASQSTA